MNNRVVEVVVQAISAEVDKVSQVLRHEAVCEDRSLDDEVWSVDGKEERRAARHGSNGSVLAMNGYESPMSWEKEGGTHSVP